MGHTANFSPVIISIFSISPISKEDSYEYNGNGSSVGFRGEKRNCKILQETYWMGKLWEGGQALQGSPEVSDHVVK